MVQLSHPSMTTGKTIALTRWTFISKVITRFFNSHQTLSRFVIAFLPRSRCLLISWLQSSSAVILDSKKTKSATVSTLSPSICYEVMGQDAMILVFWMLSFKPTFSRTSFTFIKRVFSSSLLSSKEAENDLILCELLSQPCWYVSQLLILWDILPSRINMSRYHGSNSRVWEIFPSHRCHERSSESRALLPFPKTLLWPPMSLRSDLSNKEVWY